MLLKKPENISFGARFFVEGGFVVRVELSDFGNWEIEGADTAFLNRFLIPWIQAFESGQDFEVPVIAPASLLALRQISYGRCLSYKEFSKRIGMDGAWRHTGTILSQNPVPLLLPCHRVIRSDGKPGGFMGQKTSDIKKGLLEFEKKLCQRV